MPDSPLTSHAQKALDNFHAGYSCAQSVFAAFAPDCGLPEDLALRLAAPLGAGIGRMREVCGAFCSLSMVAGYRHGNLTPDQDGKEHIYTLVQHLAGQFKSEFGSLYCRDLLGLTPETQSKESSRPEARTAAYYQSRPCERCITFCATLAEQILSEATK